MKVKEKLIMALECCVNGDCEGCPMNNDYCEDADLCQEDLMEECLDFLKGEHR